MGNTAANNGAGFTIFGLSSDNTFTGNTAEGNVDGFRLASGAGTGNVITENSIVSNEHGIHICHSGLDKNIWMPNSFSGNQFRIVVSPGPTFIHPCTL